MTVDRRVARSAAAACAALALGCALLVPSVATAEDGNQLVGPAESLLIENVHAAGKVLVIGSEQAQLTNPHDTPAAAAIFEIGETAPAIAAQEVLAYPVVGKEDVYVFTNADGEVLARRSDSDEFWRYLQVIPEPVDEAAADPLAQWQVVDAGAGQVYLHNLGRSDGRATAALDMYNWKTADGSEIQTYDAGTAAVQKWVLHSTAASVDTYTDRVDTGSAPTLPSRMVARYSWGTAFPMTLVTWNTPDPAVWQNEGTVIITGTGVGYFDEEVPVRAEYLVGDVGDAQDAPLASYAGVSVQELRMHAPTTVERTIAGSETTVTAPVSWDWSTITDATLAEPGEVVVSATASTGFAARLVITLTEPASANILRGPGIHMTSVDGGAPAALTDGNRDVNAWGDWRSGGAANRVDPNQVSFFFDEPHRLTGAGVFDKGGKNNIGTVTVQYRDMIGGWVDMPVADLTWPYANPNGALEVQFQSTPVLATGLRVILHHKSADTWKTLSEIEAYGPTLAD